MLLSKNRYYLLHCVAVFALLAAIAAGWQQQSQDLALSAWFFNETTQQFNYSHSPFIYFFGKYLVWLIPFGGAGVWAICAWFQEGLWRSVYWRLSLFFFSTPLLVGVLKQLTAMPRPMALVQFGGEHSLPSHFWASTFAQGGGALPSVHASCGFLFIAFYYVGWVHHQALWRWIGLVTALCAGLLFGFWRVMQGYHSLSQVLWSAAVVWLFAGFWFAPVLKQSGVIKT